LRIIDIKIFIILITAIFSFADEKRSGLWDFIAKIGINFGGTMPLPMPGNIDKVENYSPNLLPTIEAEAVKWMNEKIGVSAGIRSDNKGMRTTATVKEYEMNFGNLNGRFKGTVDSEMNFNYLGLPVLAHYIFTENFSIYAGAYYAYLLNGEFKGATSVGSLRAKQNNGLYSSPMNIASEEYDFSKDLRGYDVGLSLGLNFLPYNEHILFSFDFNYGLLPVFPSSFNGIADDMRNIFGKFSVGYKF
jgi:hypothetical protein